MPRVEDRSIGDRVADIRRLVDHLEVLHISTTIEIVRGIETWAPGLKTVDDINAAAVHAPVVEVVERRRDLDLLLDPRTGTRKLRHLQDDPAEFDELAARAKPVPLLIRCHEHQVDAITSSAKVTAVLGGNRAGKTFVLLWWLIRQWILRGRGQTADQPGAVFWWIGPTLERAWKFGCRRGLARLLPPELVVGAFPQSHRAARLWIRMIDGSTIEFHHAQDDGGNLKSENVEAVAGDELAEWAHVGNYQQTQSRTSQSGGPTAFATTPVAGHWGRTEIVLQEPHSAGTIRVWSIDLFQNPWMTSARIWKLFLADGTLTATELLERILPAADRAAAARALVRSARALREHFGVWTAEGIRLWAEWTEDVERECTRAGEGTRWPTLTTSRRRVRGEWVDPEVLEDCTAQACGPHFQPDAKRPILRVGGQDFNVHPQTTLAMQVFGKPEDPATWCLLIQEEIQTEGTVEEHGTRLRGIDPDLALICDPSGDIPSKKQDALDSDDASRLRALGFRVVSAVARGRKLKSQRPTLTLCHKLMAERRVYVHLRATRTLRAMQTQQARPDGRIDKRSGEASDRLSAPTDAFRYPAWKIFRHELEHATQWEI